MPAAEDIAERLALGTSSVASLAQAMQISQPTATRALRELERRHRVVRIGTTRGARYALRRPVATLGAEWPVYRIDEQGTPHELGKLNAIHRDSYYMPAGPARIRGLFEGIPYYLQDARPAGFLGRAVPAQYPELGLPPRVVDWTDEHFLVYLTQRGADATGNLIVGIESLNRYLDASQAPPVVSTENRPARYPQLATAAMAGKAPGWSAHGEHPKFSVCVADGDRRSHMLVKFSPPQSTPTGRRWADLLTAEFIAHRVLDEHGIAACRSTLLNCGDRVFLECERFDRVGADGRHGTVSLLAVDTARYGSVDNWTACAERLLADALLTSEDAERIRFLDAFGALIGNTDRHLGNVTLFDHYEGLFELAPTYDMLPMLYAPENDQLVDREFKPPLARAEWLSVWPPARTLAAAYWQRLTQESRLSADFQNLCARNFAALQTMPLRGARPAGG